MIARELNCPNYLFRDYYSGIEIVVIPFRLTIVG
jgi:hypothetical protein